MSEQDNVEVDQCGACGATSEESNLGYSETRGELVCVGCIVYLQENGHYPDEDGPDRDTTTTYEVTNST